MANDNINQLPLLSKIVVGLGSTAIIGAVAFAFTISNNLSAISQNIHSIQSTIDKMDDSVARKNDIVNLKESVADNKKAIRVLEGFHFIPSVPR